jgi:hypothetical protein
MPFIGQEAITSSRTSGTYRIRISTEQVIEVTAEQARQSLTGNSRNNPVAIASKATEFLQALVDVRIPLSELPDDDPAKHTDPGLPNFFWLTVGGVVYLVSRSDTVTVLWEDPRYFIMVVSTT